MTVAEKTYLIRRGSAASTTGAYKLATALGTKIVFEKPDLSLPGNRITCNDGVCRGAACVNRTRIPVWGLQQARSLGESDNTILEMYPVLTQDDLNAAWDYVDLHIDEIQSQIKLNEGA